jgi:phosphoserine aminotransferase
MIVTFRLPSEDLEKQFVQEATAAKLDGLKDTVPSADFALRSTTLSKEAAKRSRRS